MMKADVADVSVPRSARQIHLLQVMAEPLCRFDHRINIGKHDLGIVDGYDHRFGPSCEFA
jgi:hypothetical protein